jgi:GH15 family glucan-1,4-alpha-glucosidase
VTRREPRIADYGLIADCHSAALVSSDGSIDWYCAPRLDASSVFARLLDGERGGYCSIALTDGLVEASRRYRPRTMILETELRGQHGTVVATDLLVMRDARDGARNQLVRTIECTDGSVDVEITIAARFEYGGIKPWVRQLGDGSLAAVGGTDGLEIWSDVDLRIVDKHNVVGRCTMRQGDRRSLSLSYREPEDLDGPAEPGARRHPMDADEVASLVERTQAVWEEWCHGRRSHSEVDGSVLRSALVIKSMQNLETGAVAAAPTTSLPEVAGGSWNWDYRFSWIRDSWLMVRSLAEVGFHDEADRFRRFVERSAAGSASELQLMYGVDGRHRITEVEIAELTGFHGARPVRIGNAAHTQLQLDMYGYLLELTWRWCERGSPPDDPYWQFVTDVVDTVAQRWGQPDHGVWELRGGPRHYVYSKAMCWIALDRGIRLARALDREHGVDVAAWERARDEVRDAIDRHGVCPARQCLVETFDGESVDASALLLLSGTDFMSVDDPRFGATVDAVMAELDDDGLIRRFRHGDESADEATFVACTFWLVECLAMLGRYDEAEQRFARVMRGCNDLGLFAEELDASSGELFGNFPQGLSHLAHISAALALSARAPAS